MEHFSEIFLKWFNFNSMKINNGNSYILLSGNDVVYPNINNNDITSENKNKLPGIVLDPNFSLEDHINRVRKKGSQILNALARIVPHICLKKNYSYESICNIPIWILSFTSFDVSKQRP